MTPIGKQSRTPRGSLGSGVTPPWSSTDQVGGISLRSRSGVTGTLEMVRHMPTLVREEAVWAKTGKTPMARHGAHHPPGAATQRWSIQMRRRAGLPRRRGRVWCAGWRCPAPPCACVHPASEGCMWPRSLQKGLASAQCAPSSLTRHPSRPPPALLPRPRSSNHGGRSHSLAMQGAKVSFN